MPLDTPILAPIDMTFIGFKSNSAINDILESLGLTSPFTKSFANFGNNAPGLLNNTLYKKSSSRHFINNKTQLQIEKQMNREQEVLN